MKVLVHPRKVNWAMRDFINAASDVQYMAEADFDGENYFNIVWAKRMVKMIEGHNGFCTFTDRIFGKFEEYFKIKYDFTEIYGQPMKWFREDFISRCPMARGFANITLTLLHELGHIETEIINFNFNRDKVEKELIEKRLANQISNKEMNFTYFRFPDEMAATEWAILWLKDPAHRKLAKEFEKKFFACFKNS